MTAGPGANPAGAGLNGDLPRDNNHFTITYGPTK